MSRPLTPGVRQPAVPAAMSVATGVAADRWLSPDLQLWLLGGMFLLAATVALFRSRCSVLLTTGLLLGTWACVGGTRHHLVWSARAANDVVACLQPESRPARLIARVESPVVIDPADRSWAKPQWTQIDRSICLLECRRLGAVGREVEIRGLLQMQVNGHWLGARVGDVIEVYGRLQCPDGPRNPGGFDFANYLRSQGVAGLLRVDHPDHIRRMGTEERWLDHYLNARDRLRRDCEWTLINSLPASQVALASSLLLGDRTGLPRDTAEQFAHSGAMHLLAISGLHVGILAGLLQLACRIVHARPATTTLVLLAGVVGYALLTDQRLPVLRAALLASVVLGGRALAKPVEGYQTLALCAMVLLLFRPTDLFDAGAQLSFVAVWAIIWFTQNETRTKLSRLLREEEPGGTESQRSPLRRAGRYLLQAYGLTGAIWLWTLPLTARHFNLIAPIGLLTNVLLIPLTAMLLASGYLTVLLGLIHPLLGIGAGWMFSTGLSALQGIVAATSATPLGHLFAPAIPGWWLAGFYGLLAVATGLFSFSGRSRRAWRLVAAWMIGGLAWGLLPARPELLRCTFLAVGHGCSVLIETPSGRTLLYDAGSFSDGRRASTAIANALWARSRNRIDSVIVSHADIDHFNGLPGLIERVPVGAVLVSRPFLDFSQRPVAEVCEFTARYDIPIRLIRAGDEVLIDPQVRCRVLHPRDDFADERDNANSTVIEIEYAGRKLLLTGDLEGAGLNELIRGDPRAVDVMLSPHHGSVAANPPALREWCSPREVVISTGDAVASIRLRERYPLPLQLYNTATAGAVEVTIRPNGSMETKCFLESSRAFGNRTTR